MVVSIRIKLCWWFDIIEDFPELFSGGECAALFEVFTPWCSFFGGFGVVEPEDPFAVKGEACDFRDGCVG